MSASPTRREFLGTSATVAAAVAAVRAAESGGGPAAPPVAPSGEDRTRATPAMPTIRLGGVTVSRLILGSNPFFGFAHGNPQASGREMKRFYTGERVMAVMDQAAEQGITAVWTPCYDHWIKLWNQYRKQGGKLKIWIGQPDRYDQMADHIRRCADNGGQAVAIQGECIDRAFHGRNYKLVESWLALIKKLKLPAGMATHKPHTHLLAEKLKLPTDFYHQCVYQPENYSKPCLDQAMATIAKLAKPVVAYKVLAAGRRDAKQAFAHLLKRLKRKDGFCVGMLPNKNPKQVAQNADLARRLSTA